jgi:hypothetical protein
MTKSLWHYKDGQHDLTATDGEKRRYRETVRKVGWVRAPETIEAHAAGAWEFACRNRTLGRLDATRQERYRETPLR